MDFGRHAGEQYPCVCPRGKDVSQMFLAGFSRTSVPEFGFRYLPKQQVSLRDCSRKVITLVGGGELQLFPANANQFLTHLPSFLVRATLKSGCRRIDAGPISFRRGIV